MSSPSSPRPSPVDAFPTLTSNTQSETETVLLRHIPSAADAAPGLSKTSHMQFLVRNLVQGFPARYVSQDASQPWLIFWTIQAFSILQVGLDPGNKQRIINKILAAQHPDGGFGGGPGQAAHLLPCYASVCALAIVGRPGPGGGWDQIDRKKMYDFFMSVKQPDGSFLVAHHGEVDVRGIYCLLVTATLLDILTPELVEGTSSFIASCQTYEGGFASSSQPYYAASSSSLSGNDPPNPPLRLMETPRPPLGEAHGGYTFCALAAWVLLLPFHEDNDEKAPQIDVGNLLRWLAMMQGSEIELGGFKGRTNKLVDGCYSWWCGGAFVLLEALGVAGSVQGEPRREEGQSQEDKWDDADGQHPAGGLRDKPPKNADAYHTLYCLSGLSTAQHRVSPDSARREQIRSSWDGTQSHTPDLKISESRLPEGIRQNIFEDALAWTEEEGGSIVVGGAENRVNATHPLFNLTITHAEGLMAYFYGQELPPRVPAGSKKR
ncbi:hypothetical protein DXG01_006124 [Tephrocybe rancida]|nr:hypothetical protein DXG01_006124 [Tephrocybe rancida]